MKKLYISLCLLLLCTILAACSGAKRFSVLEEAEINNIAAVVDIEETNRSKIDIPETSAAITLPQYFEVVAKGTAAKEPVNAPEKEYFMIKFVDTDGYSAISIQTVAKGESAKEPAMPIKRGDLYFRGWDKSFTNVQGGAVIKAIYEKEWLTVRFFDADATLLDTAIVRYGEDAVAPDMKNKNDYIFSGWTSSVTNVTKDMNVYATYKIKPQRDSVTLSYAFSMLDIEENTLALPQITYYRKNYQNSVTAGKTEYTKNIIYGNFSDKLPIAAFNFKTLEGTLVLDKNTDVEASTYRLKFIVYADGIEKYRTELNALGEYKDFSVDISGAKDVTVCLSTYVDGMLYYGDVSFVGGLVNTSLYS